MKIKRFFILLSCFLNMKISTFAAAAGGAGTSAIEESSLTTARPLASSTAGMFSLDGSNASDLELLNMLSGTSAAERTATKDITTFVAKDIPITHKARLLILITTTPSIKDLFVASSKLRDKDVAQIVDRLPALNALGLHDNLMTSMSVPSLMKLRSLKILDLSNNTNLDRSVAALHAHPALEELNLSYIPTISDGLADFLKPACKIKSLKLMECGITNASLRTGLSEKFKDCNFMDPGEKAARDKALEDRINAWEARADLEAMEKEWGSFDASSEDSDRHYGSRNLTEGEAEARFGVGYYGYCMDEAHLEYMNRTWGS